MGRARASDDNQPEKSKTHTQLFFLSFSVDGRTTHSAHYARTQKKNARNTKTERKGKKKWRHSKTKTKNESKMT